MAEKTKKSKKQIEYEQKISELTADLQRTRADFENYRKRIDIEKGMAKDAGRIDAILKLLPIIDDIDRALKHIPEDIKTHQWVVGLINLSKNIERMLNELDIKRIKAEPGTAFNPEIHDAVQFEGESEGEHEVIAEELRTGYSLAGVPVRHAMVKVTRQ